MRCWNKASCFLWAAASARLSGFSFSLNFSRCYISLLRTCSKSKDGLQAHQSLLQPRGLLERHCCQQKISGSCRSPWRNSQAVAYQRSSLEDLLPAPHYVSRLKVDVSKSNAVHQADLLFLPYEKLPRNAKFTYSCWPVVNVASRYIEAEPKTSLRLQKLFRLFTSAALWSGLSWCWLILASSSWEALPRNGNGKPQNVYSSWAHWNSPRPSHRLTSQPHAHQALFQSSVCRGIAPPF